MNKTQMVMKTSIEKLLQMIDEAFQMEIKQFTAFPYFDFFATFPEGC